MYVLTLLHRSTIVWTVLGLLSGVFYREFTKFNDFTGGTQLSVAHTHALALGTLTFLALLALAATLEVSDRRFRWGVWTWHAGLGLTFTMLVVKGSLQVLDRAVADSPAIAGISGLGHITLTVAFAFLLLGLGTAVRERERDLSGHMSTQA